MKKLLKVVLVLMLAFGIQIATLSNVDAAQVSDLPDGKYTIPTKLKNASNIANDSMAAGALAENGELSVEEGKWYLTAEFKTLNLMGLVGNAGNIQYYETDTKSEKHAAEVISYREDDQGKQQVEKVKIPVAVNSEGVYIEMFVDAMGMTVDAYIQYSTADIVIPEEPEAPEYTLADGTYTVTSDVLKANEDVQSMAAQAVKSATVTSKDETLLVTLQMGAVTVYGQTAYVDKMEVEQAAGAYKVADITGRDSDGNVSEMQFTLAKNTKLTNVKFYYGGSTHGSEARLSLGLDNPTLVVPESTSKFAKDGTYTVDVALWNATQDKASMAAGAIDSQATVVVKNGVATMYITTKEMTMGTIKAWLEELYIGSSTDDYKSNPAVIVSKNADGKATMWSFVLPNEEELFDVVVNPHVAMMGNSDIPARMKVDYSTLKFVSDSIEAPKVDGESNNNTNDTPNTTTPTTNQTTGTSSSSVKTGDNANMELMGGLLVSSLVAAAYLTRKRLCK